MRHAFHDAANNKTSRSYIQNLFLCCILALAGLLRFQELRSVGLSFDESFTMRMVSFSWGEMLARITQETQPPLFYALLKVWTSVFGNTILAGRVLTALWGVFAVLAMYLFVREAYWDTQATPQQNSLQAVQPGLLAALLLAITPLQIFWSLQIRMYSMPLALALFSSYFLIRALRSNSFLNWTGYTITAILQAYTHYIGLFVLTAQYLVAFGDRCWNGEGKRMDRVLPVLCSGLILSLAWQPWLPCFLKQRQHVTGNFYLPELSWAVWGTAFDELWVGGLTADEGITLSAWRGLAFTQISFLAVLALLSGIKAGSNPVRDARVQQNNSASDVLIAMSCLLPVLILCGLSVVSQPIITARYLQFVQLFLIAAVSVVICRFPVPIKQLGVACVVGGLGYCCWNQVQQRTQMAGLPGTESAVSAFDSQSEASERLVVCNPMLFTSAIMYGRHPDRIKTQLAGSGFPFYQGTPVMQESDYAELDQLNQDHEFIWTLDSNSKSMRKVLMPVSWKLVQQKQFEEWYTMIYLRKYKRLYRTLPEVNR